MKLFVPTSAALLVLAFTGAVRADGPPEIGTVPVDPSAIYGGFETEVCGWPTTVSMLGQCTGTLIHPEIVIYAAHCGSGYGAVNFGENGNSPKRTVQTDFCRTNPKYTNGSSGQDIAFCKLATPQLDIPIVPVLMGCEVDQYLKPGQEVTIVGFGSADNGPYGIKREVVTTINSVQGNEAFIGGGGKDSCQGDSGGPVYVQIADGSWRAFGITSYGGACGTGGYYSLMHNGVEWIEQESGVDLTPCHRADGAWEASPACGSFPTEPGLGGGSWASGCGGGAVSGFSTTCGPAACQIEADVTAPIGAVTSPADDTVVMAENGVDPVKVLVAVDASDPAEGGESCGVQEVRLIIDGQEIPNSEDFSSPYEWTQAVFPSGCYEVGAKVIDFAGNETIVEPHTLCVNRELPPPPPPPPPADTDSDTGGDTGEPTGGDGSAGSAGGGSTGGGSAGGSDSATGGQEDSEVGCTCSSEQGPKASSLLLLGLVALGVRRRRTRG